MGLFIAQSEGPLDEVSGYTMAVAGAEFNVAVGLARLEQPVTYLTRLGNDPFGKRIVKVLGDNKIGPLSQKLYDTVTGIQLGSLEDKYGWRVQVD